MSITYREAASSETTAYGGLADAIGGIATIVLAICGLTGIHPTLLASIATIVFGVALMIQGGTILSDLAQVAFVPGADATAASHSGGSNVTITFLVGASGIILGVVGALGINPVVLCAVAVIAFGGALILSSNSVWEVYSLRRTASANEATRQLSGSGLLASEMASGSAGVQTVAGLVAIVLGLIAVAGNEHSLSITLVALLVIGATVILTGGALSTTVLSFMRRPH